MPASTKHSISLREHLRADCEQCVGLCCTALAFSASADFNMDKEAGQPCYHLQEDYRCGIHNKLRDKGFRGCTVYDCFGAGQQIAQYTFDGQSWRQQEIAQKMFEVFPIMLHLHELIWYLEQLVTWDTASGLHRAASELSGKLLSLTYLNPAELLQLNRGELHMRVNQLLTEGSEQVRSETRRQYRKAAGRPRDYQRGADLIGQNLRKANLIGSNLRGAYLIAADLRQADLRGADLIGADLRDTDVRGTDLSQTLFLTQSQINAAIGDQNTILPDVLLRPAHWKVK
ncbi:pentapeptide repeat-containing protein [Paenibacillus bovis]|uniref:Oxetanocin A resistance protein n=1 Tax=Paenibacillus bovis TaxID=1616788 RepID=A0A172ZMJ5_9BACL|nr:pentapeptide repeat-containing protein [Paenibacillus bovis]ANF98874.1 oxetanocin A resistance protein [Paenibacillus bovis]